MKTKLILGLVGVIIGQQALAISYEATIIFPDKEKKIYTLIDGSDVADLKINYRCNFKIESSEKEPNGNITEDVSIKCVHKSIKNSSFKIIGRCMKDKSITAGFPFGILLQDGDKLVALEAKCTQQ